MKPWQRLLAISIGAVATALALLVATAGPAHAASATMRGAEAEISRTGYKQGYLTVQDTAKDGYSAEAKLVSRYYNSYSGTYESRTVATVRASGGVGDYGSTYYDASSCDDGADLAVYVRLSNATRNGRVAVTGWHGGYDTAPCQ